MLKIRKLIVITLISSCAFYWRGSPSAIAVEAGQKNSSREFVVRIEGATQGSGSIIEKNGVIVLIIA